MINSNMMKFGSVLVALVLLSSCANTIRGAGKDAANTVNAAQSAGNNVANAAE
ncbi:entericidin B [Gellertiella hungarica]|uniref:Entericidin B n=1 Tax=Gellertiella hungarica TaxID=1572859 RepID=A0A7W6NN27_9HYPH|nr:entericidin B [Gellertiella hungarica]